MKKSPFSLRRLAYLILIGGLIFLVAPFLWDWAVEQPYQRFKEDYDKIKPDLVKLNESVLTLIPPPDGVTETERSSHSGGDGRYGANLNIVYQLRDPLTLEQVVAYYDAVLATEKWKKERLGSTTHLYFQGSGCVEILADPALNEKTYILLIWHDYLRLDFTPKPPPLWVMFIHEPTPPLSIYGNPRYAECPTDETQK